MRHPPLRAPPLPPLQADWGQLKSWALWVLRPETVLLVQVCFALVRAAF